MAHRDYIACRKCKVATIISPGEFWLTPCTKPEDEDEQALKNLETQLSNELESLSHMRTRHEIYEDEIVGVRDSHKKRHWRRGRTERRFLKSGMTVFEVFLIDYGYHITTELKNIEFIVNPVIRDKPPFAFKLCLYGILPTVPIIHESDIFSGVINNRCGNDEELTCASLKNDILIHYRASTEWMPAALNFVQQVLKEKPEVYVKKIMIIKGVVYGDIVFSREALLTQLLCENQFSIKCESFFQRQVLAIGRDDKSVKNALPGWPPHSEITPSELGETMMKMERVELWTQEVNQLSGEFSPCDTDGRTSRADSQQSRSEPVKVNLLSRFENEGETKKSTSKDSNSSSNNTYKGHTKQEILALIKQKSNSADSKVSNENAEHIQADDEAKDKLETRRKNLEVLERRSSSLRKKSEEDKSEELVGSATESAGQLHLPSDGETDINGRAVSAIKGHGNVVVISSSKTSVRSCLSAFLHVYAVDAHFKRERGDGPVAVILCCGVRRAKKIAQMCSDILADRRSEAKIVVAHNTVLKADLLVQLSAGCDLLVSTVFSFRRLLDQPLVMNMNRLHALCVADGDISANLPFRREEFLQKIERDISFVLLARKWNPQLKDWICLMKSNREYFAESCMETVLLIGIESRLVFTNTKIEVLLDELSRKLGRKIIIACKNSETSDIMKAVETLGVSVAVVNKKSQVADLKTIRHKWESTVNRVFVVIATDGEIKELNIKDADWLINYSLPRIKAILDKRFSCLGNCAMGNLFGLEKPESERGVTFLIDEESCLLDEVVDFSFRSSAVVPFCQPDSIRMLVVTQGLCSRMLEFGDCWKRHSCRFRHYIVKEIDKPSSPLDIVRFKVTAVHSPGHVSARLHEYNDDRGTVTALPCLGLDISIAMWKWYSDLKNRKFHKKPEVGSWCAIRGEKDLMYRAEIVENHDATAKVKVKLLDTGQVTEVEKSELLDIPEKLSAIRPQAVDVFIFGLRPWDWDTDWNEGATQVAEAVMGEAELQGRVLLKLGNSLLLDDVSKNQTKSLRKLFVDYKWAIWDPGHSSYFQWLCKATDTNWFHNRSGQC